MAIKKFYKSVTMWPLSSESSDDFFSNVDVDVDVDVHVDTVASRSVGFSDAKSSNDS